MAVTRVTISPKEGGPNDVPSVHSQSGIFKSRKFSGFGSDTDIVTSSARAYTSALNKLLSWNARRVQQQQQEQDDDGTNPNNDNNNAAQAVESTVEEVSTVG